MRSTARSIQSPTQDVAPAKPSERRDHSPCRVCRWCARQRHRSSRSRWTRLWTPACAARATEPAEMPEEICGWVSVRGRRHGHGCAPRWVVRGTREDDACAVGADHVHRDRGGRRHRPRGRLLTVHGVMVGCRCRRRSCLLGGGPDRQVHRGWASLAAEESVDGRAVSRAGRTAMDVQAKVDVPCFCACRSVARGLVGLAGLRRGLQAAVLRRVLQAGDGADGAPA